MGKPATEGHWPSRGRAGTWHLEDLWKLNAGGPTGLRHLWAGQDGLHATAMRALVSDQAGLTPKRRDVRNRHHGGFTFPATLRLPCVPVRHGTHLLRAMGY